MLATDGETGETACSPSVDWRIWTVSDSVNIKLQFYFNAFANRRNCVLFRDRIDPFEVMPGELR